tara:strand:- start:537 stop:1028 length:492 start_codon:yes stop_codon:yes gene_type:complete
MARSKKSNEIKYGIEITKPHSQEMYDHNDMVSAEMKQNIHAKWSELIKPFKDEMYDDWSTISDGADIVKLQKLVCFSGYGSGYTIKDVEEEFFNELEMMQNYAIHQEYAYGVFTGLLPRTKFMMVGHGWSKLDYHSIEHRGVGGDKILSPACYNSIPSSKSNN